MSFILFVCFKIFKLYESGQRCRDDLNLDKQIIRAESCGFMSEVLSFKGQSA